VEHIDRINETDKLARLLLSVFIAVESRAVMQPEFYGAEHLKQDFRASVVSAGLRNRGPGSEVPDSAYAQISEFLTDEEDDPVAVAALARTDAYFWTNLPDKADDKQGGAKLTIHVRRHSLNFERVQELMNHSLERCRVPSTPTFKRIFEPRTHRHGNETWFLGPGIGARDVRGAFVFHPDGSLDVANLEVGMQHV